MASHDRLGGGKEAEVTPQLQQGNVVEVGIRGMGHQIPHLRASPLDLKQVRAQVSLTSIG